MPKRLALKISLKFLSFAMLFLLTNVFVLSAAADEQVHAVTMPLQTGWNLITLPLQPSDATVQAVFGDMSSNVRVIWGYDNEAKLWKKWRPAAVSSTLLTLEPALGYWVYMNSAHDISLTGTDSSVPVRFFEGWNLTGYSGTDSAIINEGILAQGNLALLWGWENGNWKARKAAGVAADLSVAELTALKKDKAYWAKVRKGCGEDSPSGSETPISIEMKGSASLFPQQIGVIRAVNYSFACDTYSGMVNGVPIKLVRSSDDTLSYIVPSLPEGAYVLQLKIGEQSPSVAFNIKAQTVLADLDAILSETVPAMLSAIDAEIAAQAGKEGKENLLRDLDGLKTALSGITEKTAAMTAEQRQYMANFIYYNFIMNRQNNSLNPLSLRAPAVYDPVQCSSDVALLKTHASSVVADLLLLSPVSVLLAPTAVIAMPVAVVGAVVTAYSIAELLKDGKSLLGSVADVLSSCHWKVIDFLVEDIVGKSTLGVVKHHATLGSDSPLLLKHDMATLYNISTHYAIEDAEVLQALNEVKALLPRVGPYLPSSFSDWLGLLETEKDASSPADTYSIFSVSDSNMGYSALSANGKLQLKFWFKSQPAVSPVSFSFTLLDSRDGHKTDYNASLSGGILDHLEISPGNPWVEPNKTVMLTVSAHDSNNRDVGVAQDNYQWSSSDPSIATVTVSDLGMYATVTGKGTGNADITVTEKVSGIKMTVRVAVQGIDHIKVTKSPASSGTVQLTATAYADSAETIVIPTSPTDYTWTVNSGYGYGTINSTGLFTLNNTTSAGDVTIHVGHPSGQYAIASLAARRIGASAGYGGSISPTNAAVYDGDSVTFTITPSTGYALDLLWVDNASVNAQGSYTFTDIKESHTIQAYFRNAPYSVSVSADGTKVAGSDLISTSKYDPYSPYYLLAAKSYIYGFHKCSVSPSACSCFNSSYNAPLDYGCDVSTMYSTLMIICYDGDKTSANRTAMDFVVDCD